jgi:hypothetical protein
VCAVFVSLRDVGLEQIRQGIWKDAKPVPPWEWRRKLGDK